MITIDGVSLGLAEIEVVARDRVPVRMDPTAAERVRRSREALERLLDGDDPVYGVSTGFGRLAQMRIGREEQRALRRNRVRSHAAGVGASARDRSTIHDEFLPVAGARNDRARRW